MVAELREFGLPAIRKPAIRKDASRNPAIEDVKKAPLGADAPNDRGRPIPIPDLAGINGG